MGRQSKIEKELTPEEVVDLLEEISSTEGGTRLKTIQELAAKRGVKISLMSATSFRDGALNPYLDKIKGFSEKSVALASVITGEEENPLLDSARIALSNDILDFLMSGSVMPKQFSSLAKAISSLSGSDQSERITKARLREYEAKEEERQAKKAEMEERLTKLKSKGGPTEETLALIEDAIGLL